MTNTINPPEFYSECGRKSGQAAKRRDMAFVKFQSAWFEKALAREPEPLRATLRSLYVEAYREQARP